jgi:hypothetical protein
LPGFEHLEYGIELHINFRFQTHLREEQALRDPQQPFASDPLPEELPTNSNAQAEPAGNNGQRKTMPRLSASLRAREAALEAAAREERFRKIQAEFLRQCTVVPNLSRRSIIRLAEGGTLDPALIEDRDYDLAEVVGTESRFHLRLIPWGAGYVNWAI